MDEARNEAANTAALTISLMVRADRLGLGNATQNELAALRRKAARSDISTLLENAILPMFNDVADRRRDLFSDQVLIGISGAGSNSIWEETIDVLLPDAWSWQTESTRHVVAKGPAEAFAFRQVVCRAFWMLHPDGSFSYHLSCTINYDHDPVSLYALAFLQKALHPTEQTWATAHAIKIIPKQGGPQSIERYIQDTFNTHAAALFDSHLQLPSAKGEDGQLESPWNRFIQELCRQRTLSRLSRDNSTGPDRQWESRPCNAVCG